MAAPQFYHWLRSRTLETVDLQNGKPPGFLLKRERSKIDTMFVTTFSGKLFNFFWNLACMLRNSTFKMDLGSQKLPKSVLLQENE